MPRKLEQSLWAQVNREHPDWDERRKQAYVYGALRKQGWRPHRRDPQQGVTGEPGHTQPDDGA